MSKLYSPPTWKNVERIKGSLRYYVETCTTTYRLAGQWGNVQNPGMGTLDVADFVFNRPTVVSDALAVEMQAAGVPGTFV